MVENYLFNFSELAWDQRQAIRNIQKNKYLWQYIIQSHIIILICTMIYGAVLGYYVKGPTMISNALKMPILYLFTLYIAMPVIFIIDVMLENKISFIQISAILLLGFNCIAVVLIAFTPLMLFFIHTAPDYGFITVLTIVISGFAGYFGIISILSNFSKFHKNEIWNPSLIIGSFIIIFVGTQLAWTLRPFFHVSEGFTRPVSGNFYVALVRIISDNPEVSGILIGIFGLIAIMVLLSKIVINSDIDKRGIRISSNSTSKRKRNLKDGSKQSKKQEPQPYPIPYYPGQVWGVPPIVPPTPGKQN